MEQKISKLMWCVFITMILVASIVVIVLLKKPDNGNLGLATSSFIINATDVIGTKTGTTTAGVGFSITGSGGQSATTTYVVKTGAGVDQALATFKVKNASSSANIHISGLFSNDDYCKAAVATSTTDALYTDIPLLGDINWFDAAPLLDGHSSSQEFTVGTSTLVWDTSGLAGSGRSLLITNLGAECLALQVSGSSTVLWTQIRTK